MNPVKRAILPILILMASCVLARADTIYSFASSTSDCPPEDTFPCSLSGEFVFDHPLHPNLEYELLMPDYWTFFFPRRPFDFEPNPGRNTFYLATGASGQIIQWDIQLDDNYWNQGPDTLHFYGTPDSSFVHVYDWCDDICIACDNFYLSGGWTVTQSPAAVPEPGTLAFFSTGLLLVLAKVVRLPR
jgi:hypothetical protein